ncbi:hypothetical protein J6590_099287, partial [Homalodisca vitripennis]
LLAIHFLPSVSWLPAAAAWRAGALSLYLEQRQGEQVPPLSPLRHHPTPRHDKISHISHYDSAQTLKSKVSKDMQFAKANYTKPCAFTHK